MPFITLAQLPSRSTFHCQRSTAPAVMGYCVSSEKGIVSSFAANGCSIGSTPQVNERRLPMSAEPAIKLHAPDFTFLNPHLTLRLDWGREGNIKATATTWQKWLPSDPTSANWHKLEQFERLIVSAKPSVNLPPDADSRTCHSECEEIDA